MQALPAEYYRDYDFIHSQKDYSSEVQIVLEVASRGSDGQISNILEVGCGTGAHTREFANRSVQVTGIDTDRKMIDIAQSKAIPNSQFLHGSVNELDTGNYEGACALFNVINYIDNEKQIIDLFQQIRSRLSPGASFVFDCWNGDVVKNDPPENFSRDIKISDSDWLNITATGRLDRPREFATIAYEISGVRDGKPTKYAYELRSKLWPVGVVKSALQDAGFSSTEIVTWMKPTEPASNKAWKLMLITQAT